MKDYNVKLTKHRSFDIIVTGGGTTGFCVAIAAARAGRLLGKPLKIALIEKNGFLGGNAATGLPWLGFHDSDFKKIIGGIPLELITKLQNEGYATRFASDPICMSAVGVSPVGLKMLLHRSVRQENIHTALHTLVTGAFTDNDLITGLITAGKEGFIHWDADVIIDATDSGDAAVCAGAEYSVGRDIDGKTQVSSCVITVGGIDMEEMLGYLCSHPDQIRPFTLSGIELEKLTSRMRTAEIFIMGAFPDIIAKAKSQGAIYARDRLIGSANTITGELILVGSRVENVDMNDTDNLSCAEMDGLEQSANIIDLLKNYIPGCKNARLINSGHQLGVRETRHIDGEYKLTGDDLLTGKKFPDTIALGAYHLDIHSPDHIGLETSRPPVYEIPYRSLIPKKYKNLLVAGRTISATHEAQSSIRVIPISGAIGQAAGCAAAIAKINNIDVRDVPFNTLRKILIEQGALFAPV